MIGKGGQWKMMNNKELLERIAELEKALDKATRFIDDVTGSCPLDTFDYRLKSCDNCNDEWIDCWKRWAMNES